MNRRLRARRGSPRAVAALALTLAASAGTLAATALPAVAQDNPAPGVTTVPTYARQLSRIKARAANEITLRLRSLDDAIAEVNSYSFLGSDQAALVTNLQSDISGLQALDTKIQSDATVQQALADYYTIFSGFRIYYLVMPVVSYVVNADHVDNLSLPALQSEISSLQGQENASNQAVIGPLVADMQQEAQAASSATTGLSAQLLGYTAAEWDSNHGLLDPARVSTATADKALAMAQREYYEALRYLDHHPTTTTTTTGAPTTTSTTSEPGRLAAIQERAARQISARVNALNASIALVQSKSYLGPDQATLVSDMQSDISALQALGAKISTDTTVAQAISDYTDIFTQLRIYYLVVPVVNDVIRVDYLSNVALPADNQEISSLNGLVNASNQAVLGPLVTDMQDQIQTATAAMSGLSAQLLTFTPAEWNANHKLLVSASAGVTSANRAVAAANRDYLRALAYLRGGAGTHHSSGGDHHRLPEPGHGHHGH
jgi:hypothetical protein